MDDADVADGRIENAIKDGMARVRLDLERGLKPVVVTVEGTTKQVGLCLWCESEITPGRLFCSKECSEDKEHDRIRKRDTGCR